MLCYKKIILTSFISTSLLSICNFPITNHIVYASEVQTEIRYEKAEKTEWRFRVIDGRGQKRLWSLTYGKWLTDWEWVS